MELLKFIILAIFSVITYGRDLEFSDTGDLFQTADLNGDDDDLATAQSQYLSRWSAPNYGSYYSPVLSGRNYGNFKTNIQSQLQNQQQSAGGVRKYYGIHNGINGFSAVEGIGATSSSQSQSQLQTKIEHSGTLGDNLSNLDSSQVQAQLQRYDGSSDQIQGQLQGYGSSQQLQSQLQGYNGGSADQLQAQYQGYNGNNVLQGYGGAVEQLQGQYQGYNGGISGIGGSTQQLQSQLQGYSGGSAADQLQAQYQGFAGNNGLQGYGGAVEQLQGYNGGISGIGGSTQQLQSQLQGYSGANADQLQSQYQGYGVNNGLQGYGGAVEQLQGQYQGYNGGISGIGGSTQQLQSQLQGYSGANTDQLQSQYQGYGVNNGLQGYGGAVEQLQGQYQGYNGGISGIDGTNQQLQSQLQRFGGNAEQLQGYADGSVIQAQAQQQEVVDNSQIQGQLQGYNGDSQAQLQSQLQGYNGGSSEQLQGEYQGYNGGISGIGGSSRQLQGNSQEYSADILKGASLLKVQPQISAISSLGGGRTVHLVDGYNSLPTTSKLPVSLGWDTSGKSSLDYGSYGLGVNRELGRSYKRYNSIHPRIIPISRPTTVGYTSVNPVLGNKYKYSNVISAGLGGLSNPLLLEKDYKRYNVIRPYSRPHLSYRSIYPLTYSSTVQASPLGVYTGYKQYNIKPSLTKLYGGAGITSVGTEYQTPILEKYNDLAAYNLNRDYKHYKIVRPSIIRILKTSGTGGYSDFSLGGGYGGYTLYQPWSKSLQGQIQSGSTMYPSSNYQAQYQAGSLASSAIPVLRSSGYGDAKSLQSQYQGASGILPSSSYQGQYQASSLLSPSVQAQMQSSGFETLPNSLQQTQAQVQSSGGWDTSPSSYQAQMQSSSISKREAPTVDELYPTEKTEEIAEN